VGSLSPDQEIAFRKLILLQHRRNEGDSEEQIAGEVFQLGSPDLMYVYLKGWEFPNWLVFKDPPSSGRQPQGTDANAEELPSAKNAVELFKESYEKLGSALKELPYMRQWLKDGRFVTEHAYPTKSQKFVFYYRKDAFERWASWERFRHDSSFSIRVHSEHWEWWCKERGQDPEVEEFRESVRGVVPGGVARYPADHIVWLITNYVLTGGPLEVLLGILHRRPAEANREKIKDKSEHLLLIARQLATLLRGGEVKAGSPKEVLSLDEQKAAWIPDLLSTYSPRDQERIKRLQLPHTRLDDI
jgi:hypothetical protein